MKALLIAEKPSLMREIQAAYRENRKAIGLDIDFMAQAGHLVGLKMPDEINKEKYGRWSLDNLPIDVPYQYKVIPGKNDLVSKIRGAVKSGDYDFVIHAGDPDGEGELLVRLVLDYVGNKLPVKRFWSNDLTHDAIAEALQDLKNDSEYDNVYNAALVRQHIDYQFGMNVTVAATIKMGELYRLGRVKAPIIKMIVDREREIRNFQQTSTWKRSFIYDNCEFVNEEAFKTKEECKAATPITDRATVDAVKDEIKNVKAPKLFKLSTLQTEAHKVLGMGAAQTLSVLQDLYEAKLVSYPRTDCEYIASGVDVGGIKNSIIGVVEVDRNLIKRSASSIKGDSTYVNDKAISTEGHTAIIPTGLSAAELTGRHKALYDLIARRFLAMFGEFKQVRNISVTTYPDGNKDYGKYVWKDALDVNPGWEYILNPNFQARTGSGKVYREGEVLVPIEFKEKEVVSKPPARYNDGSLIAALDKPEAFKDDDGKVDYKIGTPATRATIIEECIKTGYFDKDKKGVFTPTIKAERIVDSIGDIDLFQVTNSGRLESMLEQVRHGSANAKTVEDKLMKECISATEDIKGRDTIKMRGGDKPIGQCPCCQGDVVSGKFGAYCKEKCGMIVSKAMGKNLTDVQVQSLLAGKKTLVKGLKSKDGKLYDAYLIPKGISDFSYKNKAGETVQGKSFKLEMEFPKTNFKSKSSSGKTSSSQGAKKTTKSGTKKASTGRGKKKTDDDDRDR